MDQKEMAIGILAGGKSSRMGENKANLNYQGSSFLRHLLEESRGFGERMVSVAYREMYPWMETEISDVQLVEDEKKAFGPMEGLYQVLKATEKQAVFVVATDMPLLDEIFFKTVSQAYQGGENLILRAEGKIQPLCSVYHKSSLAVLKEFRSQNIRKLRLLYEHIPVKYLDIEDLRIAPELLANINTPEEYHKLQSENKRL